MTYLLDTGVWLRAVNEPHTIPAQILRLLKIPDEVYGLPAISLWEVGKKVQLKKLALPVELSDWFSAALAANLEIIPITPEIVSSAMTLPDFPNHDPADELIVATARVRELTLLTTDKSLKNYRHARIRYFKPLLKKSRRQR